MLDVLPLPSFVPRIPHCVCTGLERAAHSISPHVPLLSCQLQSSHFESEGAGKDGR